MNSDDFFLQTSLTTQTIGSSLKSKTFVYTQDNLNASQPSQIRFVCDGFRSSDKTVNIAEAYLTIPLVMAYTSTSDLSKITNLEKLTLLKNHVNLIESFSVEIDGITVVQLTPKVNLINNFNIIQEENYESMNNNGSFRGFYKDDNNYKIDMFKQTTLFGQGITNNNVDKNIALQERIKY